MLLQEVSGALHPESHGFLRSLAELHDNKLPYDLVGQSWTVPNFETYFLQRLSSAVNMAAAHEIRNQVSTGVRLPCAVPKGGRRYRYGTGPCCALGSKPGAPPFRLSSRWT